MPRVKRGITHVKKRRKLLKAAKGYKWGRKNLISLAKTAVTKAGAHALADRRKKKSNFRSLWNIKINAGLLPAEVSYSKFIDALKKYKSKLNRKVLADFAENNPKIFESVVKKVIK